MNAVKWREKIKTDGFEKEIAALYGDKACENAARYGKLIDLYEETFGADGTEEIGLFSAPGRTEIGGNHTDHECGRVLAAAVDLDTIAAAAKSDDGCISLLAEGYPICRVQLEDLSVREEEKNSTASLIGGVASRFAQLGCKVGGFRAVVSSSVLPGSGLSSSAAFEVLVGNIINSFFHDGKADAVLIAQIGQYAENVYFGKPSGLMDQTASSVGNILTIDFEDPEKPVVHKLDADFDQTPELRRKFGDRAVLRAFHFYADNDRVPEQAEALESGKIDKFLRLISESGRSSWMYLQNIVPNGANEHQEMAVALALCDVLLNGKGAFRVHGGGFAGTCQAFVPEELIGQFTKDMERLLGEGCCHVLNIRSVGGTRVG